jgi:hypothetical protein
LTAGAASVEVQLPTSVSKINVLPLFATVGTYTIQKQLAVSGSKPSKDYREGQAAFSQVCSSISRAVRATVAQRRANTSRG